MSELKATKNPSQTVAQATAQTGTAISPGGVNPRIYDYIPKKYKHKPPSRQKLAKLVLKNGLKRGGVRPHFLDYGIDLYRRRFFIWFLSSSGAYNRNQGNYLGQLWSIINPCLQVAIFYVVFGKIMKTNRGISNFFSFIVIGTFLFNYIATGMSVGSKALIKQKSLMRALEFPRAVLPISTTLIETILVWPAIAMMILIVIITGEPITPKWLLFPFVLALIFFFLLGFVFILSRYVYQTPDLGNLVPVFTQLMRYFSGVFFLISAYVAKGGIFGAFCNYQPFSLYLTLARSTLMVEYNATITQWAFGFGYAAAFLLFGFIVFWKAEGSYGKE